MNTVITEADTPERLEVCADIVDRQDMPAIAALMRQAAGEIRKERRGRLYAESEHLSLFYERVSEVKAA